ncbi:MAG TPA: hypothetical protein VK789_02975 [Bryobacteraceae bacterium]|jgi:hypothetical protein|nr:hypothetical protein [Bryobacteraceae bacterium]
MTTGRRSSLIAILAFGQALFAQAPPGRAAQPPRSPRESAKMDLTGYWVSVVSEDWRWRMVTPALGDFAGIPFTPEGKKTGDAWDPARDEASGDVCKAYGAAAIMRLPGRVHITWQDDSTLKIETDTGMQTRLLKFGAKPAADLKPSRQGFSVAYWEEPERGIGQPRPGFGATREGNKSKSLEVDTTHLLPGYLRKNGFPVSGNAVVKEYFDLFSERSGQPWFVVDTIVTDPTYLQEPFVTSSNFKKEPDGSKWNPRPCSSR